MDLIDRKALLERMREYASFATSYKPYMTKEDIAFHVLKDAKEQALMFVEEAPTIEAVPVVHGVWENGCRCSKCGQFDWSKPNFCPNCGAKMKAV